MPAHPEPPQITRPPLSRDAVLSAALEMLDNNPDAPLSRRRLAGHLGVSTMSTYHYVTDEDDLREGVAELLAAELDEPDTDLCWHDTIRAVAHSFRAMVARHPGAFRYVLSGAWPLVFISTIEHIVDRLAASGIPAADADLMVRATVRLLLGCAVVEQGGFGSPVRTPDPALAERAFAFAIDTLLAGFPHPR